MNVNLSNSYRPRLAHPSSVSSCPCPSARNSMPPSGRIPHPSQNNSIMQQEYRFRTPNHSYNIPSSMPMHENIWPSSTTVYQNNQQMVMQCNNTSSNSNTPYQSQYSNGWNPRLPGASILQPIGNYELPVTHWNHPINNNNNNNNGGQYHQHAHQHPHQYLQQQQQQQPLSQGVGIMGNVHSQGGLSGRSRNNSMNTNNNLHTHGNSMMQNSQMRSTEISNNRIQSGKSNNHISATNNNTNNSSNICQPRPSQSNFQASYSHRGGNHSNQGRNNHHHNNNNHGNHSKMGGSGNMNRNGNSRHRFDTPVSSVNSSTSTSNSSSNSHGGNLAKQQTLSDKNAQHGNQSQPQSQPEIVQSQKFPLSSTKYSETKPSSAKVQVSTQPQEQKSILEPESHRVISNPADEFFAASTVDCHRLQEELLKPVKAIERTVSQNGRRRRRSSEKSILFDRRPESQMSCLSTEKSQNLLLNPVYSCKKKSAVIENMMKALVQKRDTEQVIYLAQAYDQREVYILAANYLETTDWASPSSTNKNIRELIIDFYSRADAKNSLAAFLSKVSASNASIQRNGFGFRWTFPREPPSPVILHHDEASSNDAYDADESADESELEELVRDNRNNKRINVATSISTNSGSSNIPFLQDLGSRRIQNSTSINYFVNPWRKI